MNKEEIKRALGAEIRWCKKYEQQKEYADGVKVDILENSLNLIISQEQEIERFKEENKLLNGITDEIYKEVEDNIRAEIANGGTSCHWCENIIRKKAVKEFAQKIKDGVADYLYKTNFDGHKDNIVDIFELCEIVDSIVKEYEE